MARFGAPAMVFMPVLVPGVHFDELSRVIHINKYAMKTPLKISGLIPVAILLLAIVFINTTAYAGDDRNEVPGDHFSLEGALELFKKSASPEEFEKLLNTADNRVNNLDLNGDGQTDYIRVIDRQEGNVHAFILQAIVSETDLQDIAVIELEKLENGKAVLQIVGDADIYGIETIIEPTKEVRINAGTTTTREVVNVWTWPSVQYVYSPSYVVWVSPWRWSHHPFWWRPWRPVTYVTYYSYWTPYRPYYSICHTHRVVYAHNIYRPYRTTSVVVVERHRTQIEHRRSNRDIYESRNRGYHDSRDVRYVSNDRSDRSRSYSTERSSRSYDNNSRSSRSSNDRSYNSNSRSTDVERRSQSSEQRSYNGRTSTEQRPAQRSTQRSSSEVRQQSSSESRTPQRQYTPSNSGRSNTTISRTPQQRQSNPSVGRQSGNDKPAVSSKPQQRQSGGTQRSTGGTQSGGERKRGRN